MDSDSHMGAPPVGERKPEMAVVTKIVEGTMDQGVAVEWIRNQLEIEENQCAGAERRTEDVITQDGEVEETQDAGAEGTKGVVAEDEKLLDVGKKKSAIWMYFAYKKGPNGEPENAERVTCRKCFKQYWAKGGNTSNLFKHLHCIHPEEFVKVKAAASKKVEDDEETVDQLVVDELGVDQAALEETQGAVARLIEEVVTHGEELMDVDRVVDQAEGEDPADGGRTDDVIPQDDELLDVTEKKSAVWMYFAYRKGPNGKPENTDRATCKKCRKQYWAKRGNTSNLLKHLKAFHPEEFVMVKAVSSQKEGTEGVSQDEELLDIKERRSPIWKYFAHKKGPNGKPQNTDRVTCKKCRRQYFAKDGHTSCLIRHLHDIHPEEFVMVKAAAHKKVAIEDDEEIADLERIEGTEDQDEELLEVTEKKSAVWIYFAYKKGPDGKAENVERVICKKCRKQYWAKGGNTSNLFKHLNATHPREFAKVKVAASKKRVVPKAVTPGKQMKISQFKVYSREDERWRTLTDKVTYCLAKDILPLSSIEKRSFKELLKAFDSRYELPSKTYFSNTAIPELFQKTSASVQEKLLHGMLYFSATCDLLSSRAMEPYMSFSVHYIDHEWKLQHHCLETIFLPRDHIATNIDGALRNVMEDWNLPVSKLVAMTTDNDSGMKDAMDALGVVHVPCFGDSLNLAVTKSWKDDPQVSQAVAVCKSIVSHFSHSCKKRRNLAIWQEKLNVEPQSLISENSTSWGSRQAMIRCFLKQEQPVRRVLDIDAASSHLLPSRQDMDVLKSVDQVLTPLSQFTDLIPGDGYVTSSFILPTLELFEIDLMAPQEGESELTKDMKATILKDIKGRYDKAPLALALLEKACFLDPRYKVDYMDDVKVETVKTAICEDGSKLIEEKETNTFLHPPGTDDADAGYLYQKRKFEDMLSKVKKRRRVAIPDVAEHKPTNLQILKKEVDAYIASNTIPLDSNPLKWWKEQTQNFPWLSLLARKYLSVYGARSSSKQLLSVASDIVTPTSSCLNPDIVRNLTFLAKNLD